jgi:uncharacterized protein YgfB (UPF0149 family)
MLFSRGLVWLEHYLQFADELPPVNGDALRKLTDSLVRASRSIFNDNVTLESRTRVKAAIARLRLAVKDNKADERAAAVALFQSGIALLNPKTPAVWKWQEQFARELLKAGRETARPADERKKDLRDAQELIQAAITAAPQARELEQLANSVSQALNDVK